MNLYLYGKISSSLFGVKTILKPLNPHIKMLHCVHVVDAQVTHIRLLCLPSHDLLLPLALDLLHLFFVNLGKLTTIQSSSYVCVLTDTFMLVL